MAGGLREESGGPAREPTGDNVAQQRPAEERTWWNRARDEVSSWFGDTSALARRQRDEAVGDHSGQGPMQDGDEDARILFDVNRALTDEATIDASRIRTAVRAGVVTLEGTVITSADRKRAEDLVLVVRGVTHVSNKLLVG